MKKRMFSMLLAIVMVIGMLPVNGLAAGEGITLETGHVAEFVTELYLSKIVLQGVSGTVSGSGQNWAIELAEDTDMTQPITFELTASVTANRRAACYYWADGSCSESSIADADPGTMSVLPQWENGRATVVLGVGTSKKLTGTKYTLELSVKGLAKEDHNTVKTGETRDKKYFVAKVALSGAEATACSLSDTDFSGSTSGHKATVEYTLESMPTDPVALTFTMAATGSFYIACDGGSRVEADGTYTASLDLSKATVYEFITYSSKSNSTVRGTYTIKFKVAGMDLNTAPTLADSALSAEEKTLTSGQTYTLELAPLFADAEKDALSYTVQINDADPVSAAESYALLVEAAGDYTLVFRANDGKLTSEECYTAKLKVVQNTAPTLADGAAGSEAVEQYATFTLDLTKLFADAEGDELTYTVKVDGGSAKTAGANYSYTANEEGTVTLVFQAKDHALTSPEYTLTLNVKYVPKTVIDTTCAGGENGDTWIKTFTVIGGEVESYEWNVAAGHTESEEHILNVQLKDSVADDAVLQLSRTPGYVNSSFAGSVSGPSSVTLVDGEGTATFTTNGWLNKGTPRTYILNFTNKHNNAPAALQPAATAQVATGNEFTLDLDKVFSDPDGDALTYTVTANGETVATQSVFTQTMGISGVYTFTFTATDVWNATATHTVTVTVRQSDVKFAAAVKVPEGITPEFYITNGFDGQQVDICGDKLTATAGTAEKGFVPYTVQVPENVTRISFRGVDADGNAWGGMTAEVSKDMEPVTLVKVLGVIPSRVNNVYATAEQALFRLKDKDGFYALSGSTATDTYGITNYRFLAVAFGTDDLGKAYTTYVIPQGALTASYVETVGINKTFAKDQPLQITQLGMTLKSSFAVTVPKGATVQAFLWKQYYKADEITVSDRVENADGTVTWLFIKQDASRMTYRASMEGKLTKVGYVDRGDGVTITWDETDPAPGCRTPYDTSTLYGSRGDDSMVVNVNAQNNLKMDVGGTFRLRGYRIWEVINSDTQNVMIQPDMRWSVSGDDIVTVTPVNTGNGNGKNNWLDLTATGSGVAYLEMSYDAMQVVTGNQSGFGGEELAGFVFNACDPARTALVVIQVGNAATDVSFGIRCSSTLGGTAVPWDAEFDTLYFVGNSGQLQLQPSVASGAIAKVEVSGDKGATWTELTAAEGVYTAPIVPGNNILRVTKTDGTAGYQVVRGDSVSYTLTEIQGDGDGVSEPGETFRLQLTGLHNPIGKMAGNYNPGYGAGLHLYYTFDGSTVYSKEKYQYDFVTNAWVDVTIPADAPVGSTLTLSDGYIGFNVIGISDFLNDQENHRGITDEGHMTKGSGGSEHQRSLLPEITVAVRDGEAEIREVCRKIEAIGEVTLEDEAAIAAARSAYDALTNAQKGVVYNYADLQTAEKTLAQLQSDAADAAAAAEVEALIDAIGTVDLTDEAAIAAARSAYEALSPLRKALVEPAKVTALENAEKTLAALQDRQAASRVDEKIAAIGTVTLESEEAITDARQAYNALTGAQKQLVNGLKALENAEKALTVLKNTGGVDYGLSPDEIVGYVTISFEDNGVRVAGEKIDAAYATPRGVIVAPTKVPFKPYDTIASVTLRLLEAKGITAAYSGSEFSGFYLSAIDGFGEFSAGSGSGWMVTWNGWFINKGASEFAVKDGDTVRWKYTCQLGKDIGDTTFYASVEAVMELIDKIGTVELDSKPRILAARTAYEQLTAQEKARVSNYGKLTAAEKALAELEATEEDKAAAKAVSDLIAALGTVTTDSKARVEAIRQLYDSLTDVQKALVENYEVLVQAEKTLEALAAISAEDIYRSTGDYMEQLGTPSPGSIGGEWMVIGLLRSGRQVPGAEDYYAAALQFVQENIDENGRLHKAKSTENARLILALTAMGKDASDVEGYDLVSGLGDLEYVKKQGINGPIWALIALDSGNYPAPGAVTREALLQTILEAQLADGGWALSGDVGDPDMTGMALQALAPYYLREEAVKTAVDKAIAMLSAAQNGDGNLSSIDGVNSESLAQVIVALSALGIDAHTDARFVKNGVSLVDALCGFYVEGGGFEHTPGGGLDGMATEQGYYALTAYYRMREGKAALYDMTATLDKGGDPAPETPAQTAPPAEGDLTWLVVVLAVAAAAVAAVLLFKKRR